MLMIYGTDSQLSKLILGRCDIRQDNPKRILSRPKVAPKIDVIEGHCCPLSS
jgi:hypothetical protein